MAGLKYLEYDKTDEIEVIFSDDEPAKPVFMAGNIDNTTFKMGAGNNIVDVYYEQYEVRVHFVAADTGDTLADDYTGYYRSGDSVNPVAAKDPSIAGYEPQIPYVYLEGGMPADDIEVTIFYDKEIPEIINPGGNQESGNVITDYYPDYSTPVSVKEDKPSEIAADGVSILVPIASNQTVNTEDLHTILVELDGSKVSANDYTASVDESGELIVIFSADFIKTLSKGTHTIAVKIMNEIHYITLTID